MSFTYNNIRLAIMLARRLIAFVRVKKKKKKKKRKERKKKLHRSTGCMYKVYTKYPGTNSTRPGKKSMLSGCKGFKWVYTAEYITIN